MRRRLRQFLLAALTLGVFLLCLRHWGSPDPWARLDFFSVSYIGINLLARLQQMWSGGRAPLSKLVAREHAGLTFDPGSGIWMRLLSLTPPLIFFDYGNLFLAPALHNPFLQSLGLLLYGGARVCWAWVDHHLDAHFADESAERRLIDVGPYSHIRHPRYASLLLGRIGIALLFASALGLFFALVWAIFILYRIPREEAHLRRVFGPSYDLYSRHTARLVPGIY